MRTGRRYWLVLAMLTFPFMSSATTTGRLHADGILTVNGASMEDAQVTIVPSVGDPYTLEKGISRFMLELDLDKRYLVIFEHPECLTKQLYFDTEVPDDYLYDQYTFPFQVILEKNRSEDVIAYAGPVGFIMYMDAVNDFDYETDYSLMIDEKLKEQMTRYQAPKQIDPPVVSGPVIHGPAPASVAVVATSVEIEPATEPVASRTEAPARIEPVEVKNVAIAGAKRPALRSVEVKEVPVPVESEIAEIKVDKVETPRTEEPVIERTYSQPEPSGSGREEELIVDHRTVTTVVRITDEYGDTTEYRRVAHKFGAVFYFMDDRSITDRMYYEHTGMQRMAMN